MLVAEQEFVGDARVGYEAVVGADANGEAVVDHTLDRVVFQGLEFGYGLQVGGGQTSMVMRWLAIYSLSWAMY